MSTRTVYIRREANDTLSRSEDEANWSVVKLEPEPILAIVEELSDQQRHGELESKLPLEKLRRIGEALLIALFGDEGQVGYDSRIHLVPKLGVQTEDNDALVDLVCKLPWQLLAKDGNFLSRNKISPAVVTFDAAPDRGKSDIFEHVRFPNYPEIVMIIPRSTTMGDTEAGAHEAALRKALEGHYAGQQQRGLLHFVTQFDQLRQPLENSGPKLIYFYGHGRADDNLTELLFDAADGSDDWRNIDELRDLLDSLVERIPFPPVAWINACNAGAASFNSAVRVLSGTCCSVVASRTIAYVKDAREIAEIAIPAIAIQGHAPASAVRDALVRRPPAVALGRWANTIVSVQYDLWSALAPESRGTKDAASLGDFPMRVDRHEPLEKAGAFLRSEITTRPTAPLPLVWRGNSNDSLEVFEQRLSDAIHELFYEYQVTVWRVDLNPASGPKLDEQKSAYPNRFFSECLIHALHPELRGAHLSGNAESELMKRFRARFGDGPAIVVFEHGPLTRTLQKRIDAYLAYWKDLAGVLELGSEKPIHVILGFSIEDPVPEKDGEQDLPSDLRLGAVSPRELAQHFEQFGEYYGILGDKLIGETVAGILKSTEGAFRPIHEELKMRLGIPTTAGEEK